MRSLQLRTHVDTQGQVMLNLPPEVAGQDVDLVVVFEPVAATASTDEKTQAQGWPPGFFEEVAGSLQDFPEIDFEGDYEERAPLE